MEAEQDNELSVEQAPLFQVIHQKVDLEVNFQRFVKGSTEITIHPESKSLKTIKLHARQCRVERITVNGLKPASVQYQDSCDTLTLHTEASVNQHHILSEKIARSITAKNAEELIIDLPKGLRIEENKEILTQTAGTIKATKLDGSAEDAAEVASALPDAAIARFTPLTVVIHFVSYHTRDSLHFVSGAPGEGRWPHVYTRGGFLPGRASCLFPCIDTLRSRHTWDISLKGPRTVGDAIHQASGDDVQAASGVAVKSEDLEKAFEAKEMKFICTGDITDDIVDKLNPHIRTVSFSISHNVSVQHIGFAIGAFETVNLSELRDAHDIEELGSNAVEMTAYCLPGRTKELENTCLPVTKAMDWLVRKYLACPYPSFSFCFVEDIDELPSIFAEVAICSSKLLYPEEVIDPAKDSTRSLVHAIACQWMGINIIPEQPEDTWVTVGTSMFITDMFMRELCGNNEHRFRMKKLSDRVCELDHERPSIYEMGNLLHLDPSEYNFLALKAPIVLFILDRRIAKTAGVSKMPAIIAKIMTRARTEELKDNMLSTDYFVKTVVRFFHTNIDDFINQWVKGAGCPRFSATQRFNKKKLVIEMSIRQTQTAVVSERELETRTFMRDVREDLNTVYAEPQQSVFTGPMTIRIHEADGTPYEHIVEIKEANTTVEVPYNTKYKRLKRSKRQRTKAANKAAEGGDDENDALVYCLGDTLQSEEEISRWRLTEWSPEDEEKMNSESFEWIRLDADFEWICNIRLAMPGYMFASQLQQDRDVAAQLDSIQHIQNYRASPLISTILLRTMIDSRYFHGIRSAAARALVKHATYEHDCNMIGLFHLKTAYEELYCISDNDILMTRPNDFSDPMSYYLQCAIIDSLSYVRDDKGHSLKEVKEFLLDKLRFNDNTLNDYSDAHYVSKLITALTRAVLARPKRPNDAEIDMQLEADFHDMYLLEQSCLNEIDRYRRMDEWTSSYQNLYARTALECQAKLAQAGIGELSLLHYLQYTRPGNFDMLRSAAYDVLATTDIFENPSILRYILHCSVADSSPWIREKLRDAFGRALAKKAIGNKQADETQPEGLVIEDVNPEERQQEIARRVSVDAALDALRKELEKDQNLRTALWNAITYPEIGYEDMRALLEFCTMLYTPVDEARLVLQLPRYWRMQYLGKGKLHFIRTKRVRTKRREPWVPKSIPPPRQAIKLSIKKRDSMVSRSPTVAATPTPPPPSSQQPQSSATSQNRPVLKLKFGKASSPA